MTFTETARQYLEAFAAGETPQGGMAKFDELRNLSLDGTMESLDRLDAFLLELHRQGFADEIDLDAEEHQNFLYFTGFYLGKVAGSQVALEAVWVPWEALMDANPSLKEAIPEVFGTSLLCVLGKSLYIPLSAVMARIYEGAACEKSLRSSVETIAEGVRSLN